MGRYSSKDRFEFGKNWRAFIDEVDEPKIETAEASLTDWIGGSDLNGRSVIDVGSGSGLFSLAARRLGASIFSFDFDRDSVRATERLKDIYFADDPEWRIEQGSILEPEFVKELGTFDIVYSWGVLHHTGDMWQAATNVAELVKEDGLLFISIYNDQGFASRQWHRVKRLYNRSSKPLKAVIIAFAWSYFFIRSLVSDAMFLVRGRLPQRDPQRERGMSRWHDLVDWVGGFPFEVAKPEEIFDFFRQRGFTLTRLKTCAGGIGCNEFLFQRSLPK